MKKILLTTAFIAAFAATEAQAERPTRNEAEKLAKAAEPAEMDDDPADDDFVAAAPASGNPHVLPYAPTDGAVQYNDRTIKGYQDPYAANPRAYKSNEYGDAAPAPKNNIISEYQEPSYHDPRYRPGVVVTEEYVEPIKR